MSSDPSLVPWLWTGAAAVWWATACLLSRPRPFRPPSVPSRLSVTAFRTIPRLHGVLPEAVAASLRGLAAQLCAEDQLLVAYRRGDEELLLPLFEEVGREAACATLFLPRRADDFWPNPKIDAFAQLAPHASRRLWFWSDADIRFPEGALDALLGGEAAEGLRPGDGFVTCLYRILSLPDARSLPEALFVNAEFFPGARLLAGKGGLRCAFGAGILFAPPTEPAKLEAFWRGLGPCLADDNAIGRLLGRGSAASFEAETTAAETTWPGAAAHYYRWQKTIRWCEPLGFAAQAVLHPLLGWVGWCLAGRLDPGAALHGVVVTLLLEAFAALLLLPFRPSRMPARWLLLFPAWGLLRTACWIAAWLPFPVLWRGKWWWRPRSGVCPGTRSFPFLRPAPSASTSATS